MTIPLPALEVEDPLCQYNWEWVRSSLEKQLANEFAAIGSGGGSGPGVFTPITAHGASTASSDNTAAINATIAAVKAQGGGTVYVPPGTFKFTGQVQMNQCQNVGLYGESRGSKLQYLGTGSAPAITMYSSNSCFVDGLSLNWMNTGFTGPLIDMDWLAGVPSDVTDVRVQNCYFTGIHGTYSSKAAIRANRTICSQFVNNVFSDATIGILCGDGNYFVANAIRDNLFATCGTANIMQSAAAGTGTESTLIIGNTFESLNNGKSGGVLFTSTSSGANYSVSVIGNWWGDQFTPGGMSLGVGSIGGMVLGNRFANPIGGTDHTTVNVGLYASQGMTIMGNRCENGIGIDSSYASPGFSQDVFIAGNDLSATFSPINVANIATGMIFDKTMYGSQFFKMINSAGSQPQVTGSRGGNAALASLLSTLANTGILRDGSTA